MAAELSAPQEKHSRFTQDPLQYPHARRYFIEDPDIPIKSPMSLSTGLSLTECLNPISSPAPSSPTSRCRLPPIDNEDDGDDEVRFSSYDYNEKLNQKGLKAQEEPEEVLSDASTEPLVDSQSWTVLTPAADDTLIEYEPLRHVDYLFHEWRNEDIWASWRYVTKHKDTYSNGLRLENASWWTWMKIKRGLGTISPDTLNWHKDCDVTWLYGPLMTSQSLSPSVAPPSSRLDTPDLCQDPKPILKKKTASEAILQRSLSQHTLLQHAGAILKAKKEESIQGPSVSSASGSRHLRDQSGSPTRSVTAGSPKTAWLSDITSPTERRHIHFNNEVVQCIAVQSRDEDEDQEKWPTALANNTSSEDVDLMGDTAPNPSITSKSLWSLCHGKKTIAPLPSTTLKYHPDNFELSASSLMQWWFDAHSPQWPFFGPSKESHESSEPSAANFLIGYNGYDDTNDGCHANWQPQHVTEYEEDKELMELDQYPNQDLDLNSAGTFSLGDDGEASNAGVFDRVLDTVNTAKDIAHVIWNVGWRR